MARQKKGLLRRVLRLGVVVGAGVAVRKALQDKGGVYEAPARPAPEQAPTATSSEPAPEPDPAPAPDVPRADIDPARPTHHPGVQTAADVIAAEEAHAASEDAIDAAEHPHEHAEPHEGAEAVDPFKLQ